MKKTRFFYGNKMRALLLILLAWLFLLNQGILLNQKEEAGKAEETAENESETAENESETAPETETYTEDAAGPENAEDAAPPQETTIRVLLRNQDEQSYYHQSVQAVYQNMEITITPNSEEGEKGPLILSGQEEGIQVTSLTRQQGHPTYQGNLEIYSTPSGILLINELPLETYLEAVVPSEMPSSYSKEALKAQAVCARTYALRQIRDHSLDAYGADVDDSVSYQVYGNLAPQESTSEAVRETEGEILCQNGEPIPAYYFSTSSGMTSTDEIWGAEEAASYLKSVPCSFDSQEPWSSWQVSIPWQNIQDRCSSYGAQSGAFGSLKNLEIVRKSQSGTVTGLRVILEDGSFEITGEYEIRDFLSPAGLDIIKKDGSISEGGNLLPSATFSLQLISGSEIILTGGGYGHGVGMSQNGANHMAQEGYTYQEILDYFFQNVELVREGVS